MSSSTVRHRCMNKRERRSRSSLDGRERGLALRPHYQHHTGAGLPLACGKNFEINRPSRVGPRSKNPLSTSNSQQYNEAQTAAAIPFCIRLTLYVKRTAKEGLQEVPQGTEKRMFLVARRESCQENEAAALSSLLQAHTNNTYRIDNDADNAAVHILILFGYAALP